MKKFFGLFVVCFMFLGLLSPSALASELPENVVGEDDEYYYVLDEPQVQSRTWSQAQSWSISKGTRTYLGTIKRTQKTTIKITIPVKGMVWEFGRVYSESSNFKKYSQNARITVKYKVYRKVDNKYVRTETATANTNYTDYVAI